MKLLTNTKVVTALHQFKSLLDSFPRKGFSTDYKDAVAKSNYIFDQEKKRQAESVGRIEKINVKVIVGKYAEDVDLVMNQNLSTPHDCAKHISEGVIMRSALAKVDDQYWDMHAPLTSDCTLRFLTFRDEDPTFLNRAFWRSCSIMLGAVIMNAFKENVNANLHSFPSPNVRSGSFLYDATLDVKDWSPTRDELRILSAEMVKLAHDEHPFEKLIVSQKIASEIFEASPFKREQIPDIAAASPEGKITLYRIGEHIEISRGPVIGNTNFLGRCTVAAVHKINGGPPGLYRFQGVALPKTIMLNHFAYGILEDRARKLNPARLPLEEFEEASVQ